MDKVQVEEILNTWVKQLQLPCTAANFTCFSPLYDNGDTVLVPLLSVDRINGLLMNWVNMTVVQNAVEAPLRKKSIFGSLKNTLLCRSSYDDIIVGDGSPENTCTIPISMMWCWCKSNNQIAPLPTASNESVNADIERRRLVDLLSRYDACNQIFWSSVLKENIGLLNGGCVHIAAALNLSNCISQKTVSVVASVADLGKQLSSNVLSSAVVPMKEYGMADDLDIPSVGDIVYVQPLLYQANSISLNNYYFRCKVITIELAVASNSSTVDDPLKKSAVSQMKFEDGNESTMLEAHQAIVATNRTERDSNKSYYVLDLEIIPSDPSSCYRKISIISYLYRIYAGCSICARGDISTQFKFDTGSASFYTRLSLLWSVTNALQHISNSICVEEYALSIDGIQCINAFCKTYSLIAINSSPLTLPKDDWSKNPKEMSGDKIEACRRIIQDPIAQMRKLFKSMDKDCGKHAIVTDILDKCFNLAESTLVFILRPFLLIYGTAFFRCFFGGFGVSSADSIHVGFVDECITLFYKEMLLPLVDAIILTVNGQMVVYSVKAMVYWLKRILKVEQIACDLIGSYVANERRSIMGSNSMPFTSLLSNLAAVRMVLDEHLNGVGGYIGIVVGHWKATVQKCFLVDVLKQEWVSNTAFRRGKSFTFGVQALCLSLKHIVSNFLQGCGYNSHLHDVYVGVSLQLVDTAVKECISLYMSLDTSRTKVEQWMRDVAYLQTNALDILKTLDSLGTSLVDKNIWSIGDTYCNAILNSMPQSEGVLQFSNDFMNPKSAVANASSSTLHSAKIVKQESFEKAITTLQLVNISLMLRCGVSQVVLCLIRSAINVKGDNSDMYCCFEQIASKQCPFEENLGVFGLTNICTVSDVESLFQFCANESLEQTQDAPPSSAFDSEYKSIMHFTNYFINKGSDISSKLSGLKCPPVYDSNCSDAGIPDRIMSILGLFMISLDEVVAQVFNRYELIPIGKKNAVVKGFEDRKVEGGVEVPMQDSTVDNSNNQMDKDAPCTFVDNAIYPPISEQEEDARRSLLLLLRHKLHIHVDVNKD